MEARLGNNQPLTTLTLRQKQVLTMLATGKENKQIACELGLSYHTVRHYTHTALGVLNATNQVQAVAKSIREGLI